MKGLSGGLFVLGFFFSEPAPQQQQLFPLLATFFSVLPLAHLLCKLSLHSGLPCHPFAAVFGVVLPLFGSQKDHTLLAATPETV